MSSRHRTVDSHSTTSSKKRNDNNNNETENIPNSPGDQTSVDSNTNPTENTKQNLLQISESFYSEMFLGEYKIHL